MNWHDAVSEGFPPPHEREPAALRRDIADELADHLVCAMTRELRRTDDEITAERAVLDRFGNPKAIARRLWWDAMKERIMKDRVFLVVFALGLVAIVAAFVLPWAARQNQINEAILKKLESLTPPPVASRPAVPESWSSLKVMVRETGSGQPLKDVRVRLYGKPFGWNDDGRPMEKSTDAQGVVSFGPIWPGPYELHIGAKIDGNLELFSHHSVTLYAGQERELSLVRPKAGVASDVTPHVSGPEYLHQLGCIAVCSLGPTKTICCEGTTCSDVDVPAYPRPGMPVGVDTPINAGHCEGTLWSRPFVALLGLEIGGSAWADFSNHPLVDYPRLPPGQVAAATCNIRVTEHSLLHWVAGEYKITKITICQPHVNPSGICWTKLATYEPKDMTFSIEPGPFRWELLLPDLLIEQTRQIVAARSTTKPSTGQVPTP